MCQQLCHLWPQQLGVGVSGGVEAAVHAARRLVVNLPHHHVVVKLDFWNNNVRRDLILDNIAAHTPAIYRLVHAAYSCEPILAFSEHKILSEEGAQQGDPLGPLKFREAVHPLLTGLESYVKIGFMDDLTLSGDLHTVEKDVTANMDSAAETGLHINQAKCEIIMDDFLLISTSPIFNQFIRVEKEDMMLLGAPVVAGRAQDAAIQQKIEELDTAMKRLSLLHAHDSLALLKTARQC